MEFALIKLTCGTGGKNYEHSFDRKPISVLRAIVSIFLIIIAFLGLVFSEILISFTFLAIAGLVGLYVTYGLDGIKLAFSPLQKGATKIILISYVWNILQSFAIALSLKYIFHYQFATNALVVFLNTILPFNLFLIS